jgi:AraC family transcriptional regulator, exoenzyme S synthesis regulatory protein ExsA
LESHIEANLDERLSVRGLAALAGMALPEFYLAFAGTFSRTPVAYIRKRRIEEAQRLLLDPGLTVTEIAYSLGFADGNAMGMSFKRHVGCSPTEWRRSRGSSSH